MTPLLAPWIVLAQATPADSGGRWLEYSVAGVLAAVIGWLLKVNSTDRRESTAANKEIALANQQAMREVSASIAGSGDKMEAALDGIRASIERADQRAIRAAWVGHAMLETLGPPGSARPTIKQINEAVETAARKLGLVS